MSEKCVVCGDSADPRWYVTRPACDGCGRVIPEELSEARAEIERLKDSQRVRDARVEPPPVGTAVLVWFGGWQVSRLSNTTRLLNVGVAPYWWGGDDTHEFPFWLPMPPKPEVAG